MGDRQFRIGADIAQVDQPFEAVAGIGETFLAQHGRTLDLERLERGFEGGPV